MWFSQFLHPGGAGYWFYSGLGFTVFMPVSFFLGWCHHHNCIEKGCWRKGHADPSHGHPVCQIHSPHFKETT